ncbi:MAG: hypothetical protein WC683_02875 [bacterium]
MTKKPYPSAPIIAAGHKNMVFVVVPNERGRYMRTHVCVAYVTCKCCGAKPGEPCVGRLRVSGKARYSSDTHYLRRLDFQQIRVPDEKTTAEPPVEEVDDEIGQPWVLGRVQKAHNGEWLWYIGGGWATLHDKVLMFPSRMAADTQMSVLGVPNGCEHRVMPLGEAQAIWRRLHEVATTPKGKVRS